MKKAVIIEDVKLIADIWQLILENLGISVLKTFDNADGIEDEVIKLLPDIVLMDINLKGKVDGIELASKLVELYPDIRVLVLTLHKDKSFILRAKNAGVRGYINKSTLIPEINLAIETVLNDQLYFKEPDDHN